LSIDGKQNRPTSRAEQTIGACAFLNNGGEEIMGTDDPNPADENRDSISMRQPVCTSSSFPAKEDLSEHVCLVE
jgi:hypothetical protein